MKTLIIKVQKQQMIEAEVGTLIRASVIGFALLPVCAHLMIGRCQGSANGTLYKYLSLQVNGDNY